MRFSIQAVAAVLMLCVVTGCTVTTTQGTATRAPACTVKGFEDLQATDPGCGKTLAIEGLMVGLTAREVDVQGRPVPYIIFSEPVEDGIIAMDMTGIVARDYPHTIISDIQRYDNIDVVSIVASDTCAVDEWYDVPIPMRSGCDINDSFISGRVLSVQEAARVISQPMVDRIEQVAGDSKRFASYVLTLADIA